MAFENLFIRTKRAIGGIQLDGVVSEQHTSQVRVTKHPIETGASISDHTYVEPKFLYMDVEVTDTPLGTAAFGQIVDLISGLFGSSTSSNLTRSQAAYNAMVQLQEAGEPLQIQTGLKLYENMVITSINIIQDKDTSRTARMFIALEEVILTSSMTVAKDLTNLPAGDVYEQSSTTIDRGRQQPRVPSTPVQESVLSKVSKWITGF